MLPAGCKHKSGARVVDIKGWEVCGGQELLWNLPPDTMPGSNTTLSLDNSRISKTHLSNDPVFMVCQTPGTLSQTNDSL